jgi:type IV pilus assembly protein PilE
MNNTYRAQQGFTLIEVMIAVIIIAVLAAIAYPSYNNHVVKTRRAAAAACLAENQQLLERHFTSNLSYVGATVSQCGNGLDAHYQIGLNGALAARSYSLQAVPQGQQASRDTKCGTLRVNQSGVKTVSGSAASSPGQCF